jgi:hypothetical protein
MSADTIPVHVGSFIVGQAPEFTFDVFTSAGTLTAPSSLKVITRNPAGTETVYVLGVASEIATVAAGTYTFTLPVITAAHEGGWLCRVNLGGSTTTTAKAWTFTVPESGFTTPLP